MSKSGLFAHFRSKETLQLETLDRARERFTDVVIRPTLAAPRGEQRVRALFDRWLDWETGALQGGCVFVDRDDRVRRPAGRDAGRPGAASSRTGWSSSPRWPARPSTEGDFRADLDTEQLAFTLQGLMLGYHHAARLMRDPKALAHTRRALDQLLAASAA